MKYILDANVFIQAKNYYYSFEVCPGFWNWIDHVVAGGDVASIALVRDELLSGNDELAKWVGARKKASWFLTHDDAQTQRHLARIAESLQVGQYTEAAMNEFLRGADPWIVAKAKSIGAAVVTQEVREPNSRARVPLPNVCVAESVPFVNTFDLLRKMKAEFHFTPKTSPKKPRSTPGL